MVIPKKQKSPWIKYIKIKAMDILGKDFRGNSPPTIFVGSKHINDKKANVGILSPLENESEARKYDNPPYWYENNYTLQQIVNLRANLINARKQTNILDVRNSNKFLELAQEIAMSYKPTTIDVELKKKLNKNIKLDGIHLPFGPSGNVNKLEAVGNIKVDKQIEKVFYDTDLKSKDALLLLKSKGFNENTLSQLMSIGVTGLKYNRKLVPTRWSITATDDTLGKELIKEIKNFNVIENHTLYFGNYFGNYYLILLFPDVWSYELFESAVPDNLQDHNLNIYTTTDNENYFGRKNYASETVGGYYACRLSLLEELFKIKKQASALVLRFVTSEYSIPLGVFVVRQAVRKALSSNKLEFENKKLMLNYVKDFVLKKFNYNVDNHLIKSILLNNLNKQKKLFEFL